ncbi:MAG TPA: hypothetical protein VF644_02410 [Pyrinomonadaceae bacterium]|jgi:hypothetical protein
MTSPTPLPTHLDFTTLYAAALALSPDILKNQGLPLSRLLALSQFLESIVLHETLQYELGNTPDWVPYREALENSIISDLDVKFGVPLLPATAQVDSDEASILNAIKNAVEFVNNAKLESLYWAVQFRSGTYSAISNVTDNNNPVGKRYIELAHSTDDSALKKGLENSISILNDNEIGILGLHVLIRINLHKSFWVDGGRANYYPHYSRQPLLAVSMDSEVEIEQWTMKALMEARKTLIKKVEPDKPEDLLSLRLSPIFIACLAKAKNPEDLIDEALKLRNSEAASQYRKERNEILAAYNADREGNLREYQLRISAKLNNLNELLHEKGSDIINEEQYLFKFFPLWVPFIWTKAIKKIHRKPRFSGDRTAIFLSDILSQSLGVLQAADKINKVFKTSARYDMNLLSLK